ncbi:MAG: hypothetical protein L0Y56_06890 [Nitrospira sp.]|nr:hypothetical protein [Nitrospira sp.]
MRILWITLLSSIISFISLTNNALAWYEKNPDHVTSLGISIGLRGDSGTNDLKASGTTASQDISGGMFDLTFDLRAPMSETLSLFGDLSLIGESAEADETSLLAGQEIESFGVSVRFGLRIYFQN